MLFIKVILGILALVMTIAAIGGDDIEIQGLTIAAWVVFIVALLTL